MRFTHQNELEDLQGLRISDLTSQDERHERELTDTNRQFKEKIDEIDAKWQAKLLESLEEKNAELRNAEGSWVQKEEKWEEGKRSLEEQIHALQVNSNWPIIFRYKYI